MPAPSKVTRHNARHVSSRTKDTVFENVVFELEDARDEDEPKVRGPAAA